MRVTRRALELLAASAVARLDAELMSSCPITRYDQFMSEIEAGLTRLESVVCTRRKNKIVTSYTNRNYTGKDGLDNLMNQRRNLQF